MWAVSQADITILEFALSARIGRKAMKKKSVLGLGLATVIGAMGAIGSSGCGDSSSSGGAPAATAGAPAHGGSSGAVNGTAGGAGSPTTAGAANGGSSGLSETAGSAGACTDVPSLVVFTRSDTDATWDDNDFDAVTLSGMCPTLVNVTWPHETGWQNADPAEANHESTHFTLDSGTSADLTGKKLELTIELTGDTRGPTATAGSYIVSLVSVSTWDQVVGGDMGGAGGMSGGGGASTAGASGSAGSGGTAGSAAGTGGAAAGTGGAAAGSAGTSGASTAGASTAGGGTGGASGGGGDATAGAAPLTQTAYTEAESPVAQRVTFRAIGDKATVSFPLPAKSTVVGSYDPTRVIKINVRIYSAFSDGTAGAGGAGGGGGAAGAAGSSGSAGTVASAGTSGSSAGAGGSSAGAAGSGTAGSSAGAGGTSTTAPVYDYLTSQFTISKFVIVDASAP